MKDRIYKKWMINNWDDIVWHDWNENYLDDDYIYRIKK